MVKVHGDDKEKDFTCPKCNKSFDGQHLLSKHVKSGTCDLPKNFECNICKPSKWFKLRSSMLTHMKTYHTGEIRKLTCPKYKKVFCSKKSLVQHDIIHRGLAVLEKAKAQTKRFNQRTSAAKVRPRSVGQKPSKSAPAKLVPGLSPKMHGRSPRRGGKSCKPSCQKGR